MWSYFPEGSSRSCGSNRSSSPSDFRGCVGCYQGDVILGRLAMGADFLNPAAAVELYVGATAPAAFGATYPENG